MLFAGILGLAATLIAAGRRMTSDVLDIAVFAGFPLVMIALAARLDLQWLTWVKVFSLCAAILAIHFAPRLTAQARRIAVPGIYAILVLNIAEAAAYDAVHGRWWGTGAATALIALTPRWRAITFTTPAGGRSHLEYDLPGLWIAAYTLWNAGFVATAYPAHASDHIAVLGAPLLLAWWWGGRGAWFRQRALTLALYSVMVVAANDVTGIGWIPAVPGPEIARTPLLAMAWILIGCDAVVRWRARSARGRAWEASPA